MPQVETKQQFWFGGNGSGTRGKEAEAANTYGMPGQAPRTKLKTKKTVLQKAAHPLVSYLFKGAEGVEYADDIYPGTEGYHSPGMLLRLRAMSGRGTKTPMMKMGSHVPGHKGNEEPPDDNLTDPVTGEQPVKNPQSGELKPHVDVSTKEPPKLVKEKKAERLALPRLGLYPLDSYTQVKEAAVYFDEWRNHFSPAHRREYCVNLVVRAGELSIPVSPQIEKYGSATYARPTELHVALEGRKNVLVDEDHKAVLNKLAVHQPLMHPEDFCVTLGEFDKVAGIDHLYDSDILDPFLSTFGIEKKADPKDTIVIGNDIVTHAQLETYAKRSAGTLRKHYGEEFAQEFQKDPVGIFNSMPIDQKKMLIRAATDNSAK